MSKKYRIKIDLKIKLLHVSDPKYSMQSFKVYWIRGKKKIDTRVAVLKEDTHTAEFLNSMTRSTRKQYYNSAKKASSLR